MAAQVVTVTTIIVAGQLINSSFVLLSVMSVALIRVSVH